MYRLLQQLQAGQPGAIGKGQVQIQEGTGAAVEEPLQGDDVAVVAEYQLQVHAVGLTHQMHGTQWHVGGE